MIDRLFMMWNCPECVQIKERMKPDAMFADEFRGVDGHQILVYYTFSNPACRDLLDKYGLVGKFTPALLTADGAVFDDVPGILAYLERVGALQP
jgi:hypothetical protein